MYRYQSVHALTSRCLNTYPYSSSEPRTLSVCLILWFENKSWWRSLAFYTTLDVKLLMSVGLKYLFPNDTCICIQKVDKVLKGSQYVFRRYVHSHWLCINWIITLYNARKAIRIMVTYWYSSPLSSPTYLSQFHHVVAWGNFDMQGAPHIWCGSFHHNKRRFVADACNRKRRLL